MFANPIWSAAILAGLVVLYIIVRIKHGKPLFQAFGDLSGVAWFMTWVVRFRSYIVNIGGGLLIALPDIVVALTAVDLTPLIGTAWSQRIATGMVIYNAVNTALRTKPPGEVA